MHAEGVYARGGAVTKVDVSQQATTIPDVPSVLLDMYEQTLRSRYPVVNVIGVFDSWKNMITSFVRQKMGY